jgi:outer membrane protein insertion porin family
MNSLFLRRLFFLLLLGIVAWAGAEDDVPYAGEDPVALRSGQATAAGEAGEGAATFQLPAAAEAPSSSDDEVSPDEARLLGRVIERIELRGLRRLSESIITPLLPFEPGDRYNRELARRITAALWETRLVTNVRVHPEPGRAADGVVVILDIAEQPEVVRITIRGAVSIPSEVLLAELPFKEGEIFPNNGSIAAERALRDAYAKKGYHEISITPREEILVEGAIQLDVLINEGRRLRVDEIIFEGNESYSGWWLGFELVTGESFLFVPSYFNRDIFESDIASVADFYRSQGFLRANAREGASIISDDGEWISPVIVIEEGSRYTIAEIALNGYELFTREELMAPFVGLIGRVYDREEFQEAVDAMRRLYQDEGYVAMTVEPDWSTPGDGSEVAITLSIDEGERITVGTITYEPREFDIPANELGAIATFWLSIAPPVKSEVVLRRVELAQGEPLRESAREETARQLRELQTFRSVKIEEVPTDLPTVRDIRIVTEPANTEFLYLGAATGSESSLALRARLVERNIGGNADVLSLNVGGGGGEFGLSLSYLDRDMGDSDWSARYTIFRTAIGRRAYDTTTIGASATFSRRVAARLTDSWRVRFADVKLDDIDDDVTADLDDYQVAALRYRRALNMTDNNEWPTEGYFVAGDIEGGYANTGFARLGVDASYYQRMVSEVIWASSLRADLMPAPGDRDDLGIDERLFLGGRSTVRGFRSRGASPKDPGEEDLALGGLTRLVLRNEVRFPLGVDILRGVAFFDAGWLGEDSFELGELRASTGLGLRVFTEQVNLALDFGFALVEEDTDDTQVVQFSIDSGI